MKRISSKKKQKTSPIFTSYQKFIIALLAFLQFTVILDFMIISPLGAILMPALDINPEQFSIVVSAYAFSAGISGLLSAGFADRYDRKSFLLFFYGGFLIATLLCGIATSYELLLMARMTTGLFGGVIGSIIAAIAADLFPLNLRGRVMGFIQTAFAASQILGLPLGIFLSNNWGWHAPFLMIVSISLLVGIVIVLKMEPIRGHLKLQRQQNAFTHLRRTISTPRYLFAFATTGCLSIGGFMLMPFGSDFTTHNLGIPLRELPVIYLVTGLTMIFLGPLIGKASDNFGKFNTFLFGSAVSIVMVIIYTNRGTTSLPLVILINTLMFLGIFSRMIPSQALMSAIPNPESRGSFMSVGASVQQISGGLAALLAGFIVTEGEGGRLVHFNILGYVMLFTVLTSVILMYFISCTVEKNTN